MGKILRDLSQAQKRNSYPKDTAEFSGNYEEYKITKSEGKTIVADTISNRDGTDELTDIEVLKFKDKNVK